MLKRLRNHAKIGRCQKLVPEAIRTINLVHNVTETCFEDIQTQVLQHI